MDTVAASAAEAVEDMVDMIKRNTHFDASWLPFRTRPEINVHKGTISGAFDWLNPTQANFTQAPVLHAPQVGHGSVPLRSQKAHQNRSGAGELSWLLQEFDTSDENALPANVEYKWTSRNNRKGRHAITVTPTDLNNSHFSIPPSSSSPRRILHGLVRMVTVFPITNISWQIAIAFTLGSIIYIISSLFSFLPYVHTRFSPLSQDDHGSGVMMCVGSSIFFLASVLLVLELFDQSRGGCFGWKVEQVWDEAREESNFRVVPDHEHCEHEQGDNPNGKRWFKIPSWQDFREHYQYELPFWATTVQVTSSSLFLWSGICAIPTIYNSISSNRLLLDGIYWLPKLIACSGFVTSGILDVLECQQSYLCPAFGTLGWWISFWKTMGGLSFLFTACFGFGQSNWMLYASSLSALIGSWAFLIASLLLWYECLAQYPVEVVGFHEGEETAEGKDESEVEEDDDKEDAKADELSS